MLAAIFEPTPLPGRAQRDFDVAAALRPALERIDGFVTVKRFESLARPGALLRDDGLHDRMQAPLTSNAVLI